MRVLIGEKETKKTLINYEASGEPIPQEGEIVTLLIYDKALGSEAPPEKKYYRILSQRWIAADWDMNIWLLAEEVERPAEWKDGWVINARP